MRVIVGTRNPAKVREVAEALRGVAVVGPPPNDISLEPCTELVSTEIEAIAADKAVAWSRAVTCGSGSDLPVVATDGGLLIPALGKAWDAERTRRFAGEAANDRERADALLALTAGLRGEERRIGWREAVVIARGGDLVASFVAESPPGLLARDFDPALVEAGAGFWMPALWICPDVGGRRLAELTEEERAVREDHWTHLGRELRAFFGSDG